MSVEGTPARLVFDVTGLVLRADRRPTGIERVMMEIALELLAEGRRDIEFCSFDAELGTFGDVSPLDVEHLAKQMRGSSSVRTNEVMTGRGREDESGAQDARSGSALAHIRAAAGELGHSAIEAGRSVSAASTDLVRRWSDRRARARAASCATAGWDERTTYCSIDAAFSDHDLAGLRARRSERGFRVALMVHDLIPVVAPEFFPLDFDELYEQILDVADVVIVNSEATRSDLEAFARDRGRPMPDVAKIPMTSALRDLPPSRPGLSAGSDDLVTGGFVLCVGTVTIRKNHRLLLDVWERLIATGPAGQTPKLVVAGRRGWLADETMARLKLTPAFSGVVYYLENASDEQLAWLYEHCAFTVCPSLYEGWGLPVTESHDFGKVCLASDRSSLPEAGAGLAVLLDATDRGQWVDEIRRYWLDEGMRADREVEIGRRHLRVTAADAAGLIRGVGQLG